MKESPYLRFGKTHFMHTFATTFPISLGVDAYFRLILLICLEISFIYENLFMKILVEQI